MASTHPVPTMVESRVQARCSIKLRTGSTLKYMCAKRSNAIKLLSKMEYNLIAIDSQMHNMTLAALLSSGKGGLQLMSCKFVLPASDSGIPCGFITVCSDVDMYHYVGGWRRHCPGSVPGAARRIQRPAGPSSAYARTCTHMHAPQSGNCGRPPSVLWPWRQGEGGHPATPP